MNFADFYKESIANPQAFWEKEAGLIDWHTPYAQVLDYSNAPFAKWFVDGKPIYATTRSIAGSQPRATQPH